MADNKEQGSEVARLLLQISAEYEAAQQGLSGLAQGVSQHRFITQRMERIHDLHCQLHTLVGDEAIALVATHQDQVLPANPSPANDVGRGGRSPSSSHAHRKPIPLPCDQIGERPPCVADDTVRQQYQDPVE